MDGISQLHDVYCHISTRAAYDPVKTIYLCAPERYAVSYEAAESFAELSGWKALTEKNGAVLVLPIAKNGWKAEKPTLLAEIFADTKGSIPSQSGESLHGRNGFLWCWETLIYLIGYEEGAEFAGNATVTCPNHFAAVALVDGVPTNYAPGDNASSHWLVKTVSNDYDTINRDIPVCLWMFTDDADKTKIATAYFSKSNKIDKEEAEQINGVKTTLYYQDRNPAQQIRVFIGCFQANPELSETIFHTCFARVIRWKNGPDGRLTLFMSKEDFYASSRFSFDEVEVNGNRYEFLVHLPKGMDKQSAKGLPLVFSVHGRGEPAWMFAEKNGWDTLADETQEFVLIVPYSPENIWFLERDGEAFGSMIDRMVQTYAIDRTRVYLMGFSNGGSIISQVGTKYPWLFAALSPWNAPPMPIQPDFLTSGYEMPCFIYIGDNDPIADASESTILTEMLAANSCKPHETETGMAVYIPDEIYTGQNHYTEQAGYVDGNRFYAMLYWDGQRMPRVGLTIMKNMPHGAVYDESRATWELLRRYCRPENGKLVADITGNK